MNAQKPEGTPITTLSVKNWLPLALSCTALLFSGFGLWSNLTTRLVVLENRVTDHGVAIKEINKDVRELIAGK